MSLVAVRTKRYFWLFPYNDVDWCHILSNPHLFWWLIWRRTKVVSRFNNHRAQQAGLLEWCNLRSPPYGSSKQRWIAILCLNNDSLYQKLSFFCPTIFPRYKMNLRISISPSLSFMRKKSLKMFIETMFDHPIRFIYIIMKVNTLITSKRYRSFISAFEEKVRSGRKVRIAVDNFFLMFQQPGKTQVCNCLQWEKEKIQGLVRDLNPGPLAP